jgi:hypothetical protein
MIELMMSLAVMTVGAAALFSLQGFIARANLYSRRVTQATEIADRWTERLKSDALLWTAPGVAGVANTTYLNEIATSPDAWLQAAGNQANAVNAVLLHSAASDLFGGDVIPLDAGSQGRIAFCTHYRFSWLANPATDTSMRAEVRVFWTQTGTGFSLANDSPLCAMTANETLDLDDPQDGVDDFHAVYTATIVRFVPPPGGA